MVSVWDAPAGYGQVIAAKRSKARSLRAKKHGVVLNGLRTRTISAALAPMARSRPARAWFRCISSRRFGSAAGRAVPRREGRFLTTRSASPSRYGHRAPILLDFATSRVAIGKALAHNAGKPTPDGALLDHHGKPTTIRRLMYAEPRGVVLPFGEHKVLAWR